MELAQTQKEEDQQESETESEKSVAAPSSAVPSFGGLLSLAVSFQHSKPCKCCLCGASSADPSPLVGGDNENQVDEAPLFEASELRRRPWAKYRRIVSGDGEPLRVPEGRCCGPCMNVFRLLG